MRAKDAETAPDAPFVFETDSGRNLTQSIVHDLKAEQV